MKAKGSDLVIEQISDASGAEVWTARAKPAWRVLTLGVLFTAIGGIMFTALHRIAGIDFHNAILPTAFTGYGLINLIFFALMTRDTVCTSKIDEHGLYISFDSVMPERPTIAFDDIWRAEHRTDPDGSAMAIYLEKDRALANMIRPPFGPDAPALAAALRRQGIEVLGP